MAPKLFSVGLMNPGVLPQDGKKVFRNLTLLLEFSPGGVKVAIQGLSGSCRPDRECALYQYSQYWLVRAVRDAGIEGFEDSYPWPLINRAIRRQTP